MMYAPAQVKSVAESPVEPTGWLQQHYPQKRPHYSFEDFFTFHGDRGCISDWNHSRAMLASEDFIVGLVQGLEQEVGSAAPVLMYNIGQEWGSQDAKFFRSWFEQEYQVDVGKCKPGFALEAWWWPFTSQGWGNWEIDIDDQKNGFMFINIFDSAVARTLGDVGKPVCFIYAGLFAGFFTALVQKELSCIELQCYSMGETYCKFLLGKSDRIDAATFWQNEGANARDIEKRLSNGEYLA